MKPLSSLGIGLSLVSGSLFLVLVAQLYYLFWRKKRINSDIEENNSSSNRSAKHPLYLFCWKKPSSPSSTALHPQEIPISVAANELLKPFGGDETVEAELMRLHSLAGHPRLLFTIKEETKEDMESEDGWSTGRRSIKCSGGKSLSDLFHSSDTPFMTPLSSPSFFTPPLTPLDCYKQSGFNPLFESSKEEDFVRLWSSPPPKFKFLKDAEEKLYKKKLMEEERKVFSCQPTGTGEEDGSFITIVIGKNKERGQQHHSSSSQVIPLPASPSSIRP
ncbi:hypothetical protein Cni_G13509 [Canna indica]|uniref:Membrane lipoprotein n=1 Tax=Canna indica TaxID=4628 RepID=A0AAQ3KE67_9LILI|nr:hypothetical protein Cni_G13509 [Canna indica]